MRKKILTWMSAMVIAGLMISNAGIILAESGGGGTDPSCTSGGPGSVSCSIMLSGGIAGSGGSVECSLTCGQGFYACCSVSEMGCRCKPYANSGGGGGSSS
jgi:hypothetical protein